MGIEWTDSDIAEAQRLNRRLDRLPRVRMKTTPGRWLWNLALRLAELTPWRSALFKPVTKTRRELGFEGRQVAVRITVPKTPRLRGLIVEFHGGGWTIGNARMSDRRNAEIALATGMVIISVDYRLAVHHRVEEQVDDCEAALAWALENGRAKFGSDKVFILGESAGAHLALLALLRLRDAGRIEGIAGVQLLFGLYDFAGSKAVRQAGEEVLILDAPTIRHVLRDLTPGLSEADRRAPSLSPLHADLSSLPPALLAVGECDVLHDENVELAARWNAANANAEIVVAPASPHSFTQMNTAIATKTRNYMNEWLIRHA